MDEKKEARATCTIIDETAKLALSHYGHDQIETLEAPFGIGVWPREEALERIKALPDFMKFADDTKKVRITFEYDPDFPKALLITEATLKV